MRIIIFAITIAAVGNINLLIIFFIVNNCTPNQNAQHFNSVIANAGCCEGTRCKRALACNFFIPNIRAILHLIQSVPFRDFYYDWAYF